ncbi:MAG TPA: DUF4131 domain-containing protein [Candidatus Acidoferrum sp.]
MVRGASLLTHIPHNWFPCATTLTCSGIFLTRSGHLFPVATVSVLSWIILGALGTGIANQPWPADYVLSLVEAGRLELKTPQRWHGRLRDEPARLPRGVGYEIELMGVEYEAALIPARGGLRVSFSESPEQAAAPDVHVGDEVVVATQAKQLQVFRNDGAFDRGGYLAAQNVDLVATLRAPELMERTATSRITGATREVEWAALANLENLARKKKIMIVHEQRGSTLLRDGVESQFLWPAIAPEGVGPAPKNNDSLLLRLKYGKRSVMLPGDAEEQSESSILSDNSDAALCADVLKVGHHDSKNSTMPDFLAAVHRRLALIIAGKDDPYDHPSPELLERLTSTGIRILRTDRDCAVHVLTDGSNLRLAVSWHVRRKQREQPQRRRNHQINNSTASNSRNPIAA